MNISRLSEFIDAPDCSALQQAEVTDRNFKSAGVHLEELQSTTLLRLRSLREFNVLQSLLAAHKLALPTRVNDIAGGDPAILCQAPRDWLLFSERYQAAEMLEQLRPALLMQNTWALDLSAALAVFRMTGSAAPWVLSKLCGLEVHAGIRSAPYSARTRLQHAAVTLRYHGFATPACPPVFDLIFDRGLAVYMWQVLTASVPHAEQLAQLYGSRR